MIDATAVPKTVGDWFKRHREGYQWPKTSSRKESEQRINKIQAAAGAALENKDTDALRDVLIDIHRWKTNNRGGTTNDYGDNLDANYLKRLPNMSTFEDTDELERVIRKLRIDESNLPVCTAIASFLYGRKNVPIIDKFVALFFAKKFKISAIDAETKDVLNWIDAIDFKLEKGGKKLRDGENALRLAVYDKNGNGFNENLDLYINKLVPECERIAKALHIGRHSYSDICKKRQEFAPIDVEMAIFAWASRHAKLFDVSKAC